MGRSVLWLGWGGQKQILRFFTPQTVDLFVGTLSAQNDNTTLLMNRCVDLQSCGYCLNAGSDSAPGLGFQARE